MICRLFRIDRCLATRHLWTTGDRWTWNFCFGNFFLKFNLTNFVMDGNVALDKNLFLLFFSCGKCWAARSSVVCDEWTSQRIRSSADHLFRNGFCWNVKLKRIFQLFLFYRFEIFKIFMKIELNLNFFWGADWHTRPVWAARETANESTGRPAMRPARLLHSGEFTRPFGLICIFIFLRNHRKST